LNFLGQGVNTKVAQVASHILGIPMNMINFKTSNSLTSPNAIVSGGSMVSEAIAHAVKNCCEMLLERMKPVREELKDATWVDITKACYYKDVDLCATFMYKHSDLQPYTIWVASCAEVEVDLLTGNLQIKRVDIIEDTGESMNPSIDVGQIEGAFVMGIGYWLTEKMIHHPDSGELLTNRSWFYQPPGPKDIPIDFRITMLPNSSNPGGVLRSKSKYM
jgi:xanthine dehydrogenase/oxidase